jgi:RNA polymerase sigma-70 factor (ECF subfamily)
MPEPQSDYLPTRATLLVRMRDLQNRASWQEFFDAYWKLIYGVALKSLTESEAQDVVQDVMISVAKHMPTFRYDPAQGSFKGWLLTKTRWCIIEQIRKRAKTPQPLPSGGETGLDPVANLVDPASKALDEHWEKEWQTNLYEAAFASLRRRLDPDKLQVFDFYVRKEWPAEKVAEHFHITVEQVYVAKHRITEALKDEIRRLERETL